VWFRISCSHRINRFFCLFFLHSQPPFSVSVYARMICATRFRPGGLCNVVDDDEMGKKKNDSFTLRCCSPLDIFGSLVAHHFLFGSLIRLYFSFTFLHYYWPAWFPAEYHHRLPDPVFLTHVSTHRPAAAALDGNRTGVARLSASCGNDRRWWSRWGTGPSKLPTCSSYYNDTFCQ
jgi:hypothetical protein